MSKCEKCLYYKTKQECNLCNRLSSVVDNYPAFTPNTNYDRIRNMSIEKMAIEHIYFVPNNKEFHYTGLSGLYTKTAQETIQNNIKWLESEVTE